jgi:hypothetical protein
MKVKTLSKKARKKIPKVVYALIDRDGETSGELYATRELAEADAWGPRFSPYEIRAFQLLAKSKEPRR